MKKNIEMTVGPYKIRTIAHDDIEAVRQLRNSAREAFLMSEEIDREAQERWYTSYVALGDADLMFVAVRDGQVVGMAGLVGHGPEVVEFGRLAVSETERRRGLGFAMTARLMNFAFSTGTKKIVLDVQWTNLAARALYVQLGFREAGTPETTSVSRMEATPSEIDTWQNWDRPGVADQIASYWAASPIERAHKAWLADVYATSACAGSVMDIGCGSGSVYAAIRKMPQLREQTYVGVDTSRAMLSIAKTTHPDARWMVADLRSFDGRRSWADTVICFDTLSLVPPQDLVGALRSILSAARDLAIISLAISKTTTTRSESVAGATFNHYSRTHAEVLRAIHEADPTCRVRQCRTYGENVAYVIKPRVGPTTHSVIVGSYNRPIYVRKAIRSIMDQSYPHWQIIVTDDASTDETRAAILSEFAGDGRCQLIVASDQLPEGPRPSGNVRAVERINDAIPLVRGDIVHYLPDDDWFLPGRFEAFNAAFMDPEVMMAYGVMKYGDGDAVSPTDHIYPGNDVFDPWCRLDQTQVAHRALCFEKVKKWAIENIDYAADGVFYRDLCNAGYGPVRPFFVPVSVHRRHSFNLQKGKEGATDKREG